MTFWEFICSLHVLWESLLKILLAMIVGGILGMERGKQGRAAGMRTHILVCMGAALTAMTGIYVYEVLGVSNDPLRISAQVISGIGFLGVGTILIKGRFQITGLTTAAGLWTVASIGIALGIGFYEGVAVVFLAAVLVMTIMHRVEYKITRRNTRFGIYVEIRSDAHIRKIISHLEENYRVTDMQVTAPRTGLSGNVGIEANVHAYDNAQLTPAVMVERLERLEEVVFAIESI
jgi:putative Mg2+ transporter-C (MgtC) family protein